MRLTASQVVPIQQIGLKVANHAGIAVSDLDRSIAFYGAVTGDEPRLVGSYRLC